MSPTNPSIDPVPRPRVRIDTLGCRLNEAESEEWARHFRDQGFRIVGPDDPTDLVVINTCAVTQEAVRKSRQILRRSQRTNPQAKLVISGCLATLGDSALSPAVGVDLIVANRDKDRLVEIVLKTLDLRTLPQPEPKRDLAPKLDLTPESTDAAGALFSRGRQRAFIKVQDGCRYRCTFCITTLARGDERSRSPIEIVGTINQLVAQGIQEVVLTGVHLGGYGSEQGNDRGSTLSDLIARILAETRIPRLRLGSLEPWDLGDAFWPLFEDPRLMPHLHLPLQSGSDPVLRRMARRCKTAQFAQLLAQGRAAVSDLNITTDIIVGFPGEATEDWRRTLDFAESMRFGHIHAFAYSPRAGTLAAGMPAQVDSQTKRARLAALQRLALDMKREVLHAQIGRSVAVLCEGNPDSQPDGHPGSNHTSEPQQTRFGYTPNYLPVQVQVEGARIDGKQIGGNQIVPVMLTGLDASGCTLIGRPDPQDPRSVCTADPIQ